MTDDRTPFGTALHDRVRDEHPDLDRLIRVSTSRGTRIRRWRRAGASLAVGAGVAAVAVVGSQLTGSGGTTSGEPGFASQPTASTNEPTSGTSRPVLPPGTPVWVDATGWQCSDPADEKFSCLNAGAAVAVNWRPADERQFYLDPDKADVIAGVHTFVSKSHGRFFATVAPVEGTTQAQVDEVGAALNWRE